MQASSRAPHLKVSAEDLEGALEQLEKAVVLHSPGTLHSPVLVLASTRRDLTASLLARLVQERGSVFEALPQASGAPDAVTQACSSMLVYSHSCFCHCYVTCVLLQVEAASSLGRHAHSSLRRNKVRCQLFPLQSKCRR